MGEPNQPVKRRRERWPLIFVGSFFLAVAAGRLIWGLWAAGVLRSEVNAIAARGEKLAWKDLAAKPVPDEQNAAELYKPALTEPLLVTKFLYSSEGDDRPAEVKRLAKSLDDLYQYSQFRREHHADVVAILAQCKGVLAQAHQARDLKTCDWKLNYSGPAIQCELPSLGPCRMLAKVLCLSALEAHDAGDGAAAVSYLRDALAVGKHLDQTPSLVLHLVAVAIDGLACSTVEQIAPTLRVGPAPAVSQQELKALMAELLDQQSPRAGLVRAMVGERSMQYDTFERFRTGDMPLDVMQGGERPGLVHRLVIGAIDPLFAADEAHALRYMSSYVQAAAQNSYPAAQTQFPQVVTEPGKLYLAAHWLSSMLLPNWERTFVLHYRAAASRKMAGLSLAIRLHELDAGRRPATVEELSPKYLPLGGTTSAPFAAALADPFDASGKAVRYLPNHDPPLLHCIGPDGKDDGGKFLLKADGTVSLDSPDVVYFLKGDRPGTKTKPVPPSEPASLPLGPGGSVGPVP